MCRKYDDDVEDVKSFTMSINHADYKSILQPVGDRKVQ